MGSGQSGVPDLTVAPGTVGPARVFTEPLAGAWDMGSGESGVPGLISLSGSWTWPGPVHGPAPVTIRAQTPSSSSRCARWMSDGTAGPSRSKPSPTVLFCRNLAWMPSSTTASLKQPNAM